VGGGYLNNAESGLDAVSGGAANHAGGIEENWIGGGVENSITGSASQAAIFGGEKNTTSTTRAAIP
jgi:hypothetical protein